MKDYSSHCIEVNGEDIDIDVSWILETDHEDYEVGEVILKREIQRWEPEQITEIREDGTPGRSYYWDDEAESDFELAFEAVYLSNEISFYG